MSVSRSPKQLARAATLVACLALVSALAVGCGNDDEPSASAGGGGKDTKTIKIAIGPYVDHVPWLLAHEQGFDSDLGINLETPTLNNVASITAGLKRGDLQAGWSCHACNMPLIKAYPGLRDFLVQNQFKGFVVIGRKGKTDTFDDLSKSVGDAQAKSQIIQSFKGKTFVILGAHFKTLLQGMLDQEGLTLDDVKILDFADEAKSGLAFLRGEGDYYLGGLPTATKLLLDESEDYVAVGAREILGPGGLWYSSYIADEGWLSKNQDLAEKLIAIWYRTTRFMREHPDEALPFLRDELNKRAATKFDEDTFKLQATKLIHFHTYPEAQETVFNPQSDLYWKLGVDHYAELSKADLPEDFDVDTVFVDEEYFKRFLASKDLVKYVDSPF